VIAGLAVYLLWTLLRPGSTSLPGRDSVNLYYWERFTRAVLGTGRLPFWNPYSFSGSPFLADVQTTVLYPPALLLRALPLPLFLPAMAAVHLWIGGMGALFLGRVLGLRWPAAAASAIAVMLGGSAAPWIHNGHLLVLYCAAWMPWTLALAMLSVRRDTAWPHPALVIAVGLQFLGGYVQGAMYAAFAVGAWFLFAALWPERRTWRARQTAVIQLAVLALLAGGIVAFQLLPTARLVGEAARTSGVPYEVATEGAWTFRSFARFFYPFNGAAEQPPYRDLSDGLAYIGWVLACAIPFAFVDRRRRRVVVFLALLAGTAVAFASAGSLPLYRLHYALFPGLRIPGRLLFLATVSLAVLGGIGVDQLLALASARRWRPVVTGLAISACCVVAASAVALPHAGAEPPAHAWPWLAVLAAGALSGAVAFSAAGRVRPASMLILGGVAFDLILLWHGAVSPISIETPQAVRQWIGPPADGRALSVCTNRIGPGETLESRQPDVDGLASISLADYADWAYIAKEGGAPPRDGFFRRIGSVGILPVRRDLLDQANVTRVLSCTPQQQPGLALVSHRAPVFAYRNERAWPRAFWTCGAESVSHDTVLRRLIDSRYDDDHVLRPSYSINVRWVPGTSATDRTRVEQSRHLLEGTQRDASTWIYVLGDTSPANGLALVTEPAIEDTSGIDRSSGVPTHPIEAASAPSPGSDLLVTGGCATQATVDVQDADRPDGRVSVLVNAPAQGWVFLSEPYYVERRAYVDGRPVRALRANVTFTAVPVPPGSHHVELRYVPTSFRLGAGVSVATVLIWGGALLLDRRRRVSMRAQ
jgi:hypothetical protein